jgi:hypothetical protein
MNRDNCLALAAHLRKPTTADHFDMNDYIILGGAYDALSDEEQNALTLKQAVALCDSFGCIAGHAAVLAQPDSTNFEGVWETASTYLDLEWEQADELFQPEVTNWNGITNLIAADVVEHLANTGEIVWPESLNG